MRHALAALLAGGLLGAGLAISQMMDPAKVLAFLDFYGAWDPTLAFVLCGAVIAAVPGFWMARRRDEPLLGGVFQIPTRRDIDRPLVIGSMLFGIGWGLVGLCPGPALAVLTTGAVPAIIFFAAMTAGMAVFRYLPLK